jgi:glucosamine--fructose-6-phosphate aminotransferase (isomerizing)
LPCNRALTVLKRFTKLKENGSIRQSRGPGEIMSVSPKQSKGKNGFPHFMLKEIYEQPDVLRRLIANCTAGPGVVRLHGLGFSDQQICSFSKITVAASGSSRHAGMVGEFMLERMTGIPVEVDFASQYCYRDPVVVPHELTIFLSQSGTTIDTVTALKVARRKHASSLAIVNVPETPLTQLADASFLTHAGEEVAIAATKSFTTQLTALFLLAAYFAQVRGTLDAAARRALDDLQNLPDRIEEALLTDKPSREYAAQLYTYKDFIFIGRDIDYPIALEGALKLKEVSYIHAEGYPAGELKHGPTALVSDQLPIVVLATQDPQNSGSALRYRRTVSNIREFIDREIPVLSVVEQSDKEVEQIAPCVLRVPGVPMLLQPLVEVIPLQLLAYHIAVLCGRDVDRPRHLSKSVVVE